MSNTEPREKMKKVMTELKARDACDICHKKKAEIVAADGYERCVDCIHLTNLSRDYRCLWKKCMVCNKFTIDNHKYDICYGCFSKENKKKPKKQIVYEFQD